MNTMKATLKPDFLVHDIAGEQILIGGGEQINFSKMLMLNETSAYLITELKKRTTATDSELEQCLTAEYEVGTEEALKDVQELLRQLEGQGVVILE